MASPPINSDNVVLITMVGTAIVVVGSDLQSGGIKGTHLLGLGIVYLALAAVNDFAPKLAIPFSVLVLVGVLLTRGPKVLNALGGISSSNATLSDAAKGPIQNPSPTQNTNGVVIPRRMPVRTAPSTITINYGNRD